MLGVMCFGNELGSDHVHVVFECEDFCFVVEVTDVCGSGTTCDDAQGFVLNGL